MVIVEVDNDNRESELINENSLTTIKESSTTQSPERKGKQIILIVTIKKSN